jgi:ABC-type bacteriocin/lantibiotic exporter with double-glycine peptidase domain
MWRWQLVLVPFLLFLIVEDAGGQTNWREKVSCGVNSCYFLLKYHNRDVTYSDVQSAVPLERGKGASLSDLSKACESFGLHNRVGLLKPSTIGDELPCIAHLSNSRNGQVDGHFIVVIRGQEESFLVFDPSGSVGGVQRMPKHEFFDAWSGHVMVTERSWLVWRIGCVLLCLLGCVSGYWVVFR